MIKNHFYYKAGLRTASLQALKPIFPSLRGVSGGTHELNDKREFKISFKNGAKSK